VEPLTPSDVKRWDLGAIHSVFETASGRAATLQRLGDNLQQVHDVLADWQGEAGDAFRVDVGKVRRDIEADGAESKQVAAAVSRAEADVRACKTELDDIQRAADANGWTITPDWRIDVGNTGIGLDPISFAAEQQALQEALNACKVHAHTADHELATAIRGSVGDIPLDATGGGPPPQGQPNPAAAGKPKTWQDMLLPTGAGDGDPARLPQSAENALTPAGAGGSGGKPPSLEDLLTGRGQPSGPGGQQPASLSDMLSRLAPPGAAGAPAPQLKPAEVESFKAMARKTMADAGMPPDQIEAHLDEYVANAQQWMADGGPHYVPPEPPSPPPPGFGEGFADRWFATEQQIKNLTGQEGLSALGDSWGGMAKGLAGKAEEFATQGPVVAGINDLTSEVKNFLDSPSPAYYAGEKAADGAVALPGLMFGGEGAAAGELGELDAAAGLSHDLPVGAGEHFPTGIGDHHSPLTGDHSIPDWSHGDDPYPVDDDGHYLPGSLPSYEQLQSITSTEPNTAYYWSGRNIDGIGVGPDDSGIAELIAHGSGGTTLEMTLADNGVDPLPVWNRHDPVSVKFWEDASTAYAENAQGEVTGVIGRNLRPGNVWQTIEIPRLIENPDVSRIVQIDPDTGQLITIFERGK
jgi:uncharacterized protein YukE